MELQALLMQCAGAVGIGHHRGIFEVIRSSLSPHFHLQETEQYLLAELSLGREKTLLLEAHADEVGMIVTEVFDDGFLSVTSVGSVDGRFLPSTPVTVYGTKPVAGVFTSVPPHLKKEETCPSFEECYIDTGIKNIGEIVSLGDLVHFDAKPLPLQNGRLTGKALDNRTGVAAVITAANRLAEQKDCPVNLRLLFPLGEELGLRGARVGAFAHPADEAVVVDVSFGDHPEVPSHQTARLGSGAMIGCSPVLSRRISDRLVHHAKAAEIPYTLEVMGGTTSTDADVISVTATGIPTGLVSIPLRNMHTPCEVVDLADVAAVSDLLYHYAMGGGLDD